MSATQQVLDLYQQGKAEEAQKLLDEYIEKQDPEILYLDARIKINRGDYNGGFQSISLARSLYPDNLDINYYFAYIIGHLGSQEMVNVARDIIFDLLEKHGDSQRLLSEAVRICRGFGPQEDAPHYCERLARVTDDADDYFTLSESHAHLNNHQAAFDALKQAFLRNPEKYGPELDRLLQDGTAPKSKVELKTGIYPTKRELGQDVATVIHNHVANDFADVPRFITADTRFLTIGSCNSLHQAQSLRRHGHQGDWLSLPDSVFSTFGIRYFADYLSGGLDRRPLIMESMQRALKDLPPAEEMLQQFKEADVVWYSVGAAGCFFDRQSKSFILPDGTALGRVALTKKYEFKTTSVSDNAQNIVYFASFLRSINPKVKVLVSVAPAPTQSTYERRSAVVADCLSKSILRVACHEATQLLGGDVYYWPAFETFRWLSGHIGATYGVDDGNSGHISESIINNDVKALLQRLKVED